MTARQDEHVAAPLGEGQRFNLFAGDELKRNQIALPTNAPHGLGYVRVKGSKARRRILRCVKRGNPGDGVGQVSTDTFEKLGGEHGATLFDATYTNVAWPIRMFLRGWRPVGSLLVLVGGGVTLYTTFVHDLDDQVGLPIAIIALGLGAFALGFLAFRAWRDGE